MKYQLMGKLTIWQHCYDNPHPVAGRPAICKVPGACPGHLITQELTEVVEADSAEEAIELSMSMYEGGDLEPTWCEGYPKTRTGEAILKQQIRTLMKKHISEWTASDTSDLTEATFELQSMGWQTEYPAEGQVRFKRIKVTSRTEAVRLGYVPE